MTLEAAYVETAPKIVGYLVAAGAEEGEAQDMLHNAVVKVARLLEQGRTGPGDLQAYLFATARNLYKNFVRDNARLSFVASTDKLDSRVVDGRGATATSDAAYFRNRISAALAALPDAIRETYSLYQIGGRSVRETAELTSASENLVKVRLHRAKLALRKSLADLNASKPQQ